MITQNDLGCHADRFVVVDGGLVRLDMSALTTLVNELTGQQIAAELEAAASANDPVLTDTRVGHAELNYREGAAHVVADLRRRAAQHRVEAKG